MNYRALVDAIAAEMIAEMGRKYPIPAVDRKTLIECVQHDEYFSGFMDNLKDDVGQELDHLRRLRG